ncbi:MAG: ABC transporter ATP-binding protein [Cyclobacteriaceae bacterium]
MSIIVKGLSKVFSSGVKAADGISFKIKEGEIISVLGESGSGKSTLLRLLAGLEDADNGSITVGEEKITGPKDNLVPGYDFITLVYQDFNLQRFKTVAQNIATEVYFLDPDRRERHIKKLLRICLLTDKAESLPDELSGGQQQRLAIAIALAKEPQVVLMDEPFSNLDSRLKFRIRQEVTSILKRAGVTVIMVSHDHADAMTLADRIMIMRRGKIIQVATPEQLYYKPKTEYAANFLGPMNYLFLNGDSEKTGVRPEQIKISRTGKFHGVVSNSIFQGLHYHVYVKSDISKKDVLMYADKSLDAGKEIQFQIQLPSA